MATFRLGIFALVIFAVAFFGGRFLLGDRTPEPEPSPPAFESSDAASPQPRETTAFASDSDSERNALRNAVLTTAKELSGEPCSADLRTRYVEAATNYANARLNIAPCIGTKSCRPSDAARIERAQKAFGTSLDNRVRDAMSQAHSTGAVVEGDFTDDTAALVAEMASDPVINPDADAALKASTQDARPKLTCRSAMK